MRLGVWLWLCGLLWAGGPQPPAYLRLQPAHRIYSDAEGLPQNSVLAMEVDREGVLWAGTEDGPARFDGTRWERLAVPLRGVNMATALAADPVEGMWVGTGDDGLWAWRQHQWQGPWSLPGVGPQGSVRALRFQGDRLWIAYDRGLAFLTGAGLEKVPIPEALGRPEALLTQGAGLWVAGRGGLAFLLEGRVTRFIKAPVGAEWRALAVDGDGQLCVGGVGGVYRLEGERLHLLGAMKGRVRALVETRDAKGARVLWVGTEQGLWAWDGAIWVPVLPGETGLRQVLCLRPEEDSDPHHGLWVGTDTGGMHRLEWSLFLGVTAAQGSHLGAIMGIARDGRGTHWMAGMAPWITAIDEDYGVRREPIPASASFVIQARGNQLLLGTEDGRVLTREGRGPWRERLKVPGALTRALLWDDELGLVAGFRDGGLWQVAPGGQPERLLEDSCRAILRQGPFLYVGMQQGVRRFRCEGARLVPDPGWVAAEGQPIGALAPWKEYLAVGTFTEGLFLVDPTRPQSPLRLDEGTTPALPHPCVYALAPLGERLWVATNRGVVLLERRGRALRSDTFFRQHGLPANETNQNGLSVDADGTVWVGTINGAAVLDPALRVRPEARPLRLWAEGYPGRGSVVMSRGARLRVRASWPGFYREGDVQYRFQVEDSESEPGPWQAKEGFDVRGLDAGSHRILAWARHPEMDIQGPVSLVVEVPRPWWRHPVVVLGGMVFLAFVILRALRRREAAHRRRNQQLAAEVEARTAELQSANANLRELESNRMRLTSMIIHDVRSPLQAVMSTLDLYDMEGQIDPDAQTQARTALRQVEGLCNEVLELGSAAQGELRVERGAVELGPWMEDVATRASVLARPKAVTVTLEKTVQREAHFDTAKLDRVLMNLIGNALKFTPREGRIGLGVSEVGTTLHFWVEDSGPGIPEELRAQIFEPYQQGRNGKGGVGLGLTIVRTFVEAHGGRVWLDSPSTGGARFMVEIPLQ